MNLDEKLAAVVARHEELGRMLAAGGADDPQAFARKSKEYADMSPVVESIQAYRKAREEAAELAELIADSDTEEEMRELAEAELAAYEERLPALEEAMRIRLLPKDEADERNAILEVRSGTGGDEAALFAADLMRMYQRYAENHRWKFELLEASETGLGGYKEAIASVTGQGVFARLKFESGVHRVQRVPTTEAGGRIHTSAATVAVLPEAEAIDVDIDPGDLRVDTYRAQGAGGQHVNKTDSAVRITHLPTGIVVTCQDDKSQHKNRAKAMKVLLARLYEAERDARDAERAASRRAQVGSGDRSQRIRTYNFPQGRVTDHRVNLTMHKLEQMLAGEALDEIIDALVAEDQATRLAELE